MIDRVTVGRQSYVVGLHAADRRGFERGSCGEPREPNPYKRTDFVLAYEAGWARGVKWRLTKSRSPS
jgi:hypothetical protein